MSSLLRVLDDSGTVLADIELSRLHKDHDGAICAIPASPVAFPAGASRCQILTNGAVGCEGTIRPIGRSISVADLDREFGIALEVQRRQLHRWIDRIVDQACLDAAAKLIDREPDVRH